MGPGSRPGRHWRLLTRLRDLAAQFARVFLFTSRPLPSEGAGKAGCALHPRSRVQGCTKKCAHEHTGSAENIRPSLRNGFTAYSALSPATNSCCHRRLRIDDPAHPGWVLQNLRRLDISNGCQDHTSSPYAAPPPQAPAGHLLPAEVLAKALKRRSSARRLIAHGKPALRLPIAPDAAASTASQPAFVTIATRPSFG